MLIDHWAQMLAIVCYAVFFIVIGYYVSQKYKCDTRDSYLCANREISGIKLATSIAATWIWAPALFVAAQMAYVYGWVGVFWFTVPNVLTLIIFAYFAVKIKEQAPEGYTLPQFMQERYGNGVNSLYLIQTVGLAVCAFAVQILAGSAVLYITTGIPIWLWGVILILIALTYTWKSGIRVSIITDNLQMLLIAVVCFILVPWTVINSGGISNVIAGIGGRTGEFVNLFGEAGMVVFWATGLVTAIGLLSAPYGDQMFWQRIHSAKKESIKKGFITGAFIFALVPLLMSLLGFAAAGASAPINVAQYVNLEMVGLYLPAFAVIIFTLMVLSGLLSTMDSVLCGVSSIAGQDAVNRLNLPVKSPEDYVKYAKIGMLLAACAGFIIANIPGMQILYLFLFYGTLRSSTCLPTVLTLLKKKLHPQGVFYGILIAMFIGVPAFAIFRIAGDNVMAAGATVFAVLASGIVAVLITKVKS